MSVQLIQRYYKEVDDLIQYGGSNIEAVISHKFGDLIDGYCKKRSLILIPQLDYKTKDGKLIRPDGTIKNPLRIEYGFWESKANVNLDDEIRKKFNVGYPKNNILFEDHKTAILFQDGEEVKRCKIDDEIALDKLLTLFVAFEHPFVKTFNEAIEQFKVDIPKVVEALNEMIAKQESENSAFKQKRNTFHELCKHSINPNVTIENVNEMLIQHILTEEIFISVFSDAQFIRENNIAKELYEVEETFFTGTTKRQTLDSIKNYYEVIKNASSPIADHHEKQRFLKALYENFYKAYNPKAADRLGVVYTPNEIVKFQVESVDYLLHKHFGRTLASPNVEILDPATGTGTYICEIIEYLPKQHLAEKYKHELHANEISILPYYIANLNIEYTFRQKMGYYEVYKNICFVDTLDNVAALGYEGKMGNIYGFATENANRIKEQNQRKISVVMGNPPYNANQQNENDNNKNRIYEEVDKRIKDTYIKNSTAQKTKAYDMYTRFFRWASDRLKDDGIVCFITNNSLINARTYDGFRKSIQEEFDFAYIIDLGGNIRELSGKDGIWMNEEHTIFGVSAAVGICITYLVKIKGNEKRNCKINYLHPCDIRATRIQKFDWLQSTKFNDIAFEQITPDKNSNWINLADNDFETLLQLINKTNTLESLFSFTSNSIKTNRDEWVYDFNKENLKNKMNFFIDIYNREIQNNKGKENIVTLTKAIDFSIKWSRDLKNEVLRKRICQFQDSKIIESLFRPFVKNYFYSEFILNDVLTSNHYNVFGANLLHENKVINISDGRSNRDFHLLSTNIISDYHYAGDTILLPLSYNDKSGNRIDNLTDWGLEQFKNHYKTLTKLQTLSKLDIFHYVYAVLHNPAYRKKYELNLKREFPRIPFYDDFYKWVAWGKELMDLHINYETVEPYQLRITNYELGIKKGKQKEMFAEPEKFVENLYVKDDFVPKAKLKANKETGEIVIDEITTLSGIPSAAWEYKLGIRSALEWILDQYKESTPSDPTIREKFNTYKFANYKEKVIDLLKRVCTVSVRTVEIMKEMENEL